MARCPIDNCPKCGNDEFYVKERITGTCEYNYSMNSDDANIYNGEMYEGTRHKIISKYAYCNGCGKRLFQISETDLSNTK